MAHKKREWQDRAAVSRRDFVKGAVVGAGAALSIGALGLPNAARAQTVDAPLRGLGPDWTGPSGIGDYQGKNGNTADVVNAAHGHIRNGDLDARTKSALLVDDVYDLVIVGAGISGLTSAFTYHRERPDAKILVLDQHAIFGGEAKQNEFEVDGYRIAGPQGSTGMIVPFSRAINFGAESPFIKELGLPDTFSFQKPHNTSKPILVPRDVWSPMHFAWETADTAFYYEDHGMVVNPWRNGFRDAPIPEKLKKAFVDLDLFRTPPVRDDWPQWLDSMTYKDFLLNVAGVPADCIDGVVRYLDPVVASIGLGQGCETSSAYAAFLFLMPGVIGYHRYLNDGADPSDATYLATFPGGNTFIARKLLKLSNPDSITGPDTIQGVLDGQVQWDKLDGAGTPVRTRVSSTVFSIVHEGTPGAAKTVRVTYERGGRLEAVQAKAVICAGQQHANKRICHDLNAEYRDAMQAFAHSPMLVINVALRNWRFLDKLGVACVRWFEGLGWWTGLRRNLVIDGHELQPLDPDKPVVLTQYIPFVLPDVALPEACTQARMALFSMSYDEIQQQVRDQFNKMFKSYGFDDQKDIAAITINRQGHAYFVAPPGFFFGSKDKKAPKDILREPFHRIAFGHSELSGMQMWSMAVLEGQRAARQTLGLSA